MTIFQKYFFKILSKLKYGKISIVDGENHYYFIGKDSTYPWQAVITVNNEKFYREILLGGSNGAAESYIRGHWDVDGLEHLLEIVIKNKNVLGDFDKGFSSIFNAVTYLLNSFSKNTKIKSKKNILAHYDLGNDFFGSFLDETMLYSSAIYASENDDLYQASLHKLKVICDLLKLNENDHLLEIGTGWGGLAIYAATHYGCKVTTTTISDKQYIYVKEKISRLGLNHKITLLSNDYRELTGIYDKIVSVEMIEAVGHQYLDIYFKHCNRLLKIDGLMLLQAIVINDQSYERAKNSIDFIKKYIFPGGFLPSIQVIQQTVANDTNFQLLYLNDIGKHYVKTLHAWLYRFNKNIALIRSLGYSESFIRMWRYYLCYCAAGFNQAYISDVHLLWRKRE